MLHFFVYLHGCRTFRVAAAAGKLSSCSCHAGAHTSLLNSRLLLIVFDCLEFRVDSGFPRLTGTCTASEVLSASDFLPTISNLGWFRALPRLSQYFIR